jgi:heat-inducible transcriptional repressor
VWGLTSLFAFVKWNYHSKDLTDNLAFYIIDVYPVVKFDRYWVVIINYFSRISTTGMLTKRQQKILNTVIKEYTKTGQPVSSQLLEKKHDFGIKPAMIRIEMQKLTDKGYLLQPHTSAGRVPTDKAYRFFVDGILGREFPLNERMTKIEEIFREEKDIFRLADRLTKFMAEETSSLAILDLPERDFIFKEGWEELLKETELFERDFFSDFAKAIEQFEQSFKDFEFNSGIKVYIGKESKVPKAKNLSVISAKCKLPNKEKATLTLVGPKRMDYNRNLSLVQSLNKYLER